jgi:hypothetical protein
MIVVEAGYGGKMAENIDVGLVGRKTGYWVLCRFEAAFLTLVWVLAWWV